MSFDAVMSETFRIKPFADSDEFFAVHVADDLKSMHAAMERATGYKPRRSQIACVWEVFGRDEYAGIVGLIFFSKPLGAGLVAHEMTHAAFRAVERRGIEVKHGAASEIERVDGRGYERVPDDDPEEIYANVVERLVREFWAEAYERKLA